jgi:hypothetical protein
LPYLLGGFVTMHSVPAPALNDAALNDAVTGDGEWNFAGSRR